MSNARFTGAAPRTSGANRPPRPASGLHLRRRRAMAPEGNRGIGKPRGVFARRLAALAAAAVWAGLAAAAAAQTNRDDETIAGLRSPSTRVRIDALRTLADSGTREAAEPMAALVLDGNDRVQQEAIRAILGLYLVRNDLADRVWGPEAAEGRAGSLAEAAFEAGPLAAIPGPVPAEVLTALSAAMREDDNRRTRLLAAYALGVLGAPHMGVRPDAAERQVGIDVAYALQHRDDPTRQAVARVAGRLYRHQPGLPQATAVGDALIAAMNDRDALVRRWAMDSLGWLRYDRAVQALTDRVAYYGTGEEGTAALHALARTANPTGAPLFRRELTNAFLPFRIVAIEGLARLEACEALPAIEDAAATARDAGVSLAAELARYRCGQGDVSRLVAALDDRGTEVQARVYLEEIGTRDPEALAPMLTSGNPAIRALAARITGASRDAKQENALQALLQDPSPPVVEAASEGIRRLRAYGGTAPAEP